MSVPASAVLPAPSAGRPFPLGASLRDEGTNFSVFSVHATSVELLFFEDADAPWPSRTMELDPDRNCTSHYWHILVPGCKSGQLYGFRVHGPDDPAHGQRFDSQKLLVDPYARAIAVGLNYSRAAACRPGDTAPTAMKSVVADLSLFDWEGDKPLNHSFRQTVIYEMHVAGFTRNPNSGVSLGKRGTYLGVVEKIPYLQSLGVTAVELLPVFQFDSQNAPNLLENYWGYDPVSFFSPHLQYSTGRDALHCLDEFRTMVKQLHRAGIEVILDVVYNHTSEGDEHGPTVCFRGLENASYYLLDRQNAGYANYTGTGNTLKANHSVVKRMIVDSLTYWVSEMHVDGFRFDLASIFSRNESGEPMLNPPIITEIDSHPMLAGTKLIAEAWDAAGLYQVGSFGPDKWKEWNGQFRDDIRAFIKGDRGTVVKLRERITGSFDLYGVGDRPTGQSINFVTCHDGFTVNDLVTYSSKHNKANRQGNADGTDRNLSWNCGVEGGTQDEKVRSLRTCQVKNLLALTLICAGTPMLLMGDEVRRTQKGNNNAYCQNNETSWFDWTLCKENSEILDFARKLIHLRISPAGLRAHDEGLSLQQFLAKAQFVWHGIDLCNPDWGDDSHAIAFTMQSSDARHICYVAINSYWESLAFELPGTGTTGWYREVDTSLLSPHDVSSGQKPALVTGLRYIVNARSVVILSHEEPKQAKD